MGHCRRSAGVCRVGPGGMPLTTVNSRPGATATPRVSCAATSLRPIPARIYLLRKNIDGCGDGPAVRPVHHFISRHASSATNMADDESRTPRPKGGANPYQLSKAKKKFKQFDSEANTEYKRLLDENTKKQLSPNTDPAQHATFYWLCELRTGWSSASCPLRKPCVNLA